MGVIAWKANDLATRAILAVLFYERLNVYWSVFGTLTRPRFRIHVFSA